MSISSGNKEKKICALTQGAFSLFRLCCFVFAVFGFSPSSFSSISFSLGRAGLSQRAGVGEESEILSDIGWGG
jgi:hypothetical protein